MFNKITIVGMGLIGGSIGMACVRHALAREVMAVVRRDEARREVRGRDAAHDVTLDLEEGVAGSELVIFAADIDATARLAHQAAPALSAEAIVTDVSSVKTGIVRRLDEIFDGVCRFVGSHPMAGGEFGGIAHASPDLFRNAICLVTPTERTDPGVLERVAQFWRRLGCTVKSLGPEAHDEAVGLVSHLPHVAVAALMNAIGRTGDPRAAMACGGPSFRDVTRIASSPPEMWTQICLHNRGVLLEAVRRFRDEAGRFVELLDAGDAVGLRAFFAEARRLKALEIGPTAPAEPAQEREPRPASKGAPPPDPLIVRRPAEVKGTIEVPGDKSISHRAAILSSIAEGASTIGNVLASEDVVCTLDIMRALGVHVEWLSDTSVHIEGAGPRGLHAPNDALWCGNSGTSMRLLAGLLAGQPFRSVLDGDESLRRRPMRRIIEPLAKMGAVVQGTPPHDTAPLTISGGWLRPIGYVSPVASAQVKTCILLAALYADGVTSVTEPRQSRDHTERMLPDYGVVVTRHERTVAVEGRQPLAACDLVVPGDLSSAMFFAVLAACTPGSLLTLRGVGLNPTRVAALRILQRMGAKIGFETSDYLNGTGSEPRGDIIVIGDALEATMIEGDQVPNAIDELPVLAVAAACANGRTVIKDAAELRVKESDRIATTVANLRAMGAQAEETDDGMVIEGPAKLHGAELDSFGDHRIAMAFAIAGMLADGETAIRNTACIATSFPTFHALVGRFLSA
ncbi:MAG: 3-phosphoshikimate 1-carboxyvinyltransferase [Verrucomicrobia bacterium]|nr:3-phosphoshikimate 1-carboxyvinyltransferase [Verrucomicrobiota bacterium]